MTLPPKHPHGSKLCDIFTYRWKWLEAPLDDFSVSPKWKTNSKYPIKDRTLWNRHQDAGSLVGVRFGRSTSYALIDIDKHSPYLEMLDQIRAGLETIGIVRTVLIRSSCSGGIHIYCPLPQAFPTFSVACALKACLEAQGYLIEPGKLEIFPNTKAYGKSWLGEFTEYNGHRLPLQPGTGSCLIDDDGNTLPDGYSLSRFFAQWDNAAQLNDANEIAEALCVVRANRRHRRRRATGPVEEWKRDLEEILKEGWTGSGQTNKMLQYVATYCRVFRKLSGEQLTTEIAMMAFDCPGYAEHCSHKHEIHRRCHAWARAVEKYYWPLGDEPLRERKSLMSIAADRANDAKARISEAVQRLTFAAGMSIRAMAQIISKEAQTSMATLYKYKDLWHPQHQAAKAVTPDPEQLRELQAGLAGESKASPEIPPESGVTALGGDNEACNLKSSPQKFTSGRGGEGVVGGEEGFSTAPGVGWLPRMDWKEGAVRDQ